EAPPSGDSLNVNSNGADFQVTVLRNMALSEFRVTIGTTLVAKFLRVGVHHSNVGGYTSKAWTIRRIGSTVFLKWGSVEVRGVGRGRRIYWAVPPRQKTIRCDSEKPALDYVKRAI